jgi:lysophospholipase L1-like esterase
MSSKYPGMNPLFGPSTMPAGMQAPVNAGVLGRNGATVASMKATVDADLAQMSGPSVVWMRHILINLGSNDFGAMPLQAQYEADLTYILDALHAKWPTATLYVARAWNRTAGMAAANTLAGWTANVVTARASFTSLGPDERTWLENGDDGATYTYDGTHYSAAGNTAAATQWMTVMGY